MKITVAYLPEDGDVSAVVAAILRLYPDAKVRKSDRHAPYRHIYMTTKKPAKADDFKENA